MLTAAPPVSRSTKDMNFKQIASRLDAENQLISRPRFDRTTITGVTSDSREVDEGDLFIAVRGTSHDGHEFIPEAIEQGASAIVAEEVVDQPGSHDVPVVTVRNSRQSEGLCADEFYGNPSDQMTLIGVTGTNGKTTTVKLIHELLEGIGHSTGLIGTIDNRVGQRVIPSDRTTPPPCKLHSLLDQMKENGCSYAVLEVSSHGLDQDRVSGVSFDAAVFTNLSRDHLDYHGSMEAYRDAKAKLFERLPGTGIGVVNADNEHASAMSAACDGRVVTYSRSSDGSRYAADVSSTNITGSSWEMITETSSQAVNWMLPGTHNIENAMAAVATVRELTGANLPAMSSVLEDVEPARGRLDPVSWDGDFEVFVDYAHTPDALENVRAGVSPLVEGSVRAVFGCGGDRDRGKRPKMGRVVDRYADQMYVTSDNPRSEKPEAIIDDILEGIERTDGYVVDPDRESAIQRAIQDAEPGDAVLILGKGHEMVQKQDGVVKPFKDWAVAEKHLDRRKQDAGIS